MKTKKTRITFILPGRGTYPVGGFRIVYEYANRLSELGLEVTLVHTAWLHKSHSFMIGVVRYIYCMMFYKFYKKWFNLNHQVTNKWVLTSTNFFVPDSDFVVATSWETSENVVDYDVRKGKKLYFIQGNESEFIFAIKKKWQKRVLNTWNFPLQKIVISSWLHNKVTASGNTAVKIFNGLNFDDFFLEKNIENRNQPIVMMLYHESPAKGCGEGLRAFSIIKKNIQEFRVILFGVSEKPKCLEDWIEYHRLPSREKLRNLYNSSTIFLSPSHSEGWGLPVVEAMQCGCAVITTDIGGFKDFVEDNYTGLCFEVKNVDDMVEKILTLLNHDESRISLAKNGNNFIKKFRWDNSLNKFMDLLEDLNK